jgi:hypothetical protein
MAMKGHAKGGMQQSVNDMELSLKERELAQFKAWALA